MNQPAQLIEVIPAMTPESLEQVRQREEAARQERLARLKEALGAENVVLRRKT